ncbi:putative Flagellar assembly protein T C-terminal domain-containing protein [Candidatus Magnetomoraceae bacterium gMMP-15]
MKTTLSSKKISACIFVFILIFIFTGCSLFKKNKKNDKIVQDLSERVLRKSLGLVIFENKTEYNNKIFMENFYKDLALSLKKTCTHSILEMESDSKMPVLIKKVPRLISGLVIDNQALAEMGRNKGLNAIITGKIIEIKTFNDKKGIYGLRKIRPFVYCKTDVTLYDCETGSKIFYKNLKQNIELDDSQFDQFLKEKKLSNNVINILFSKLAADIADQLCDIMKDQLWKGFIIKKENEQYIISSGKKSGLKQWDTLNVYGSRGMVKGINNQYYLIPGVQIGKIKLVDVLENQSKAIVIHGKDTDKSSCVKKP